MNRTQDLFEALQLVGNAEASPCTSTRSRVHPRRGHIHNHYGERRIGESVSDRTRSAHSLVSRDCSRALLRINGSVELNYEPSTSFLAHRATPGATHYSSLCYSLLREARMSVPMVRRSAEVQYHDTTFNDIIVDDPAFWNNGNQDSRWRLRGTAKHVCFTGSK